jgi:hypothetical protein
MRLYPTCLLIAILSTAVAEAAPEGGQDPPGIVQRSGPPDFLFGRPDGSIGVRGSWVFARAGSDWYDFVTDQLTVEPKDFNAAGVAGDLGFTIAPRVDVVAGFEYSQTSTLSEYRRFVDNNRLPINQTTRLRTFNLTGSVKFALTERGRDISRLAWVPKSVVPFVGAGGGALWYELDQRGDFVDFVDRSVFASIFDSKGWTPSAHVLGGVDVRVFRRVFVTIDGRYHWAAATLGSTWVDFDPIDLAGFRLSLGMNMLF